MKKVSTKKVSYFLAALGAASLMTITGCKKNESTAVAPATKNVTTPGKQSPDDLVNDLKKIRSLGFDPLGVEAIPGGYRVEGDIVLTKKNLDASFAAQQAQQGQYSTQYPISIFRTINVAFYDDSNTPKFSDAFDAALVDLNNLKLPLKFVRVTDTTKADIITRFALLDGEITLGQDGQFVDPKGNPGRYISLNTNPSAGYTTKPQQEITTILEHEFGHAIGLRHTDYRNRLYGQVSFLTTSNKVPDWLTQQWFTQLGLMTIVAKQRTDDKNGAGTWDKMSLSDKFSAVRALIDDVIGGIDEGNPAGLHAQATHLYGTPLTPVFGSTVVTDPSSIMLSAINPDNITYSLYDNIAFFDLYGNPAQTALIKSSLSENGNVIAGGKTLAQVVAAVKALSTTN